MNALANETSPYLLQHKDNPVDWLPWGPEALDRARREDRPLLVSIGYSSCHWCHVMERESFENGVRGVETYVNDRERRTASDQQGVRALFDEAQRCEIFDQAAVEVRLRGEVELLERLARRQLGEPQPALQAALLDRLDLMVEKVVQELGVGRLVALGGL
jgi:hypothetical protein